MPNFLAHQIPGLTTNYAPAFYFTQQPLNGSGPDGIGALYYVDSSSGQIFEASVDSYVNGKITFAAPSPANVNDPAALYGTGGVSAIFIDGFGSYLSWLVSATAGMNNIVINNFIVESVLDGQSYPIANVVYAPAIANLNSTIYLAWTDSISFFAGSNSLPLNEADPWSVQDPSTPITPFFCGPAMASGLSPFGVEDFIFAYPAVYLAWTAHDNSIWWTKNIEVDGTMVGWPTPRQIGSKAQFASDVSPALYVYGATVLLVWKGLGESQMYYSYTTDFDFQPNTWSAPAPINPEPVLRDAIPIATDAQPVLCANYQNPQNPLLFWKGAGTSDIFYCTLQINLELGYSPLVQLPKQKLHNRF